MQQRQGHGGLAAHAVTDHRCPRQGMAFDETMNISGHCRVVHTIGPRAFTMIPEIQAEHVEMRRQRLGDAGPVSFGTKQAMQDDQRWPLAEGCEGEFNGHLVLSDSGPGNIMSVCEGINPSVFSEGYCTFGKDLGNIVSGHSHSLHHGLIFIPFPTGTGRQVTRRFPCTCSPVLFNEPGPFRQVLCATGNRFQIGGATSLNFPANRSVPAVFAQRLITGIVEFNDNGICFFGNI